jgi:uncharacterized membrane-anchored protein
VTLIDIRAGRVRPFSAGPCGLPAMVPGDQMRWQGTLKRSRHPHGSVGTVARMPTIAPPLRRPSLPAGRQLLNKVPQATAVFWMIKIMATTVGETAADFLNEHLGLGLTGTTLVMTIALVAALYVQFRTRRYVPACYWLAVVLISVVGTLASDNLVDNFGVALETTTALFAVCLLAAFVAWYRSERTLSIHTIVTRRREAFYWLAILCTFALGTSAGDLVSERLNVGYWKSALLFGSLIAIVAAAYRYFRLNAVTAFWAAYILTRPLGASIGDYLTSTHHDGGLGLGTNATSLAFLAVIIGLVVHLTRRERAATPATT